MALSYSPVIVNHYQVVVGGFSDNTNWVLIRYLWSRRDTVLSVHLKKCREKLDYYSEHLISLHYSTLDSDKASVNVKLKFCGGMQYRLNI